VVKERQIKKKEKDMVLDKSLTELESVGTAIDTTGMTYPIYEDGTHDEEMGCHIEDIENDEWFENLSYEDIEILKSLGFAEEV